MKQHALADAAGVYCDLCETASGRWQLRTVRIHLAKEGAGPLLTSVFGDDGRVTAFSRLGNRATYSSMSLGG